MLRKIKVPETGNEYEIDDSISVGAIRGYMIASQIYKENPTPAGEFDSGIEFLNAIIIGKKITDRTPMDDVLYLLKEIGPLSEKLSKYAEKSITKPSS